MLSRLLNSQTKTIGAAAGILAISALISRLLGLVREGLLASTFGAGPELDIYFVAFRVPDLVYSILVAGGIVVAFLPLFSEYFSRNETEAWQFTSSTLNVFLLLLISLCLVLFIFTPSLVRLIAPGFNPQQMDSTIFLTRLMLLSPIFFGLSSILSGVLHYFNRFLVYSLCPILYNLGIIFGILFLAPHFGILGVSLGVILGAALHFVIQIPSVITCGFKYKPLFNFKHPGIKRVFALMVPRMFGTAGLQINLIVITAIASTLSVGSVAIFNFANNLQHFPVGIIGASFAIAVFPVLSRSWAKAQKEEFITNFSSVFRQVLYLTIPVSALIFVLRNQIIGIILKHGQFGAADAQLTATCLGLFSFGIFALSLNLLLSRVFFSLQDTKTPTIIVLLAMALNIILSFYFIWLLKFSNSFTNFLTKAFSLSGGQEIAVIGLPLAFSIGAIFHFILLMIFLYRKIGDYKLEEIGSSALKIVIATVLMVGVSYLALNLISPFLNLQTFSGLLSQAVIVSLVAVLVYILVTFFLKSPELRSIWKKLGVSS